MIRTITMLSAAFCLTACGVTATPVSGPSGGTSYSMVCQGMGRTKEACYQKAGEICPQGYNIEDSSTGALAQQNTLLITCR